jgi:hypothetical protein
MSCFVVYFPLFCAYLLRISMIFKKCAFSNSVALSVGAMRHYRKAGSDRVYLSPMFIDRSFNFLSTVCFDSAEGRVSSSSVFDRCSADYKAHMLKTHIISGKNHDIVTLPKPLRVSRNKGAFNIKAPIARLFRKKSSHSFLLMNFTRSFLYNTDMYSVYCRNIIILSLRNVKLHLSFDYTDKSFVDEILSTDISAFSFFNR